MHTHTLPTPPHPTPHRDVDGADTSTTTPQQRMESPQKFGVWLVSGLGVVVAFRGTANEHDMMVNLELEPEPIHVGDAVDGMLWYVVPGVQGCMHPTTDGL